MVMNTILGSTRLPGVPRSGDRLTTPATTTQAHLGAVTIPTGDSDPNPDEALRRVRRPAPALRKANDTLGARCPVCRRTPEDCTCISQHAAQDDACGVCGYFNCRCTPWTSSHRRIRETAVTR
jgi:hypothetical protein